jgi:uncharacterized protein HemX
MNTKMILLLLGAGVGGYFLWQWKQQRDEEEARKLAQQKLGSGLQKMAKGDVKGAFQEVLTPS